MSSTEPRMEPKKDEPLSASVCLGCLFGVSALLVVSLWYSGRCSPAANALALWLLFLTISSIPLCSIIAERIKTGFWVVGAIVGIFLCPVFFLLHVMVLLEYVMVG